jgi:hypothetical protein
VFFYDLSLQKGLDFQGVVRAVICKFTHISAFMNSCSSSFGIAACCLRFCKVEEIIEKKDAFCGFGTVFAVYDNVLIVLG